MDKRLFTIACATTFLSVSAASGLADAPAAHVVTESDLLRSLDAPEGGHYSLSKDVVWSRVGDDRVSVDMLTRTSPEEGPVVHQTVTEVYRVVQGGGTLETGGALVGPKPMVDKEGKPLNPANIGPSQVGTGTSGGHSQAVHVGDVVLIPPGTPHRFTKLDGSITYMVIRFNPRWFSTNK
jgi:mannose-6-phosphate isomerase-like protein (cupin superfamily)